jgi:S-adenosylmethionine:tRNA ribosyltransferase-isomerase
MSYGGFQGDLFSGLVYKEPMRTTEFDYHLPNELVAQTPSAERDLSRLLVFNRNDSTISHKAFCDIIQYLKQGDLLVVNDSRVIPARLRGRNFKTGGEFELLLLEENFVNDWWAMVRPGKRAQLDTGIELQDREGADTAIIATVTATNPEGHRRLSFTGTENVFDDLSRIGEVPLPPYIERSKGADSTADKERYQTVYAKEDGSVAAPTAGLHFTNELLHEVRGTGTELCYVTLHVGPGTFSPVKSATLSGHVMHEERFVVTDETAARINAAKAEGRRVIAVGTTSVRVLESVVDESGKIVAGSGRTRIFIYPPYRFRIVDALVTNFHLPCSTLLMLVSAFAAPGETRGRETILSAYAEAVRERYRFFSYGDAMLIV